MPLTNDAADGARGADVLGHPRGLVYLCVSEAWERFSYFGMQSLLVLYLTHQLLLPGHVEHVAGFEAFRAAIERVTGPLSTLALASQIFGLYTGLVYLTPLLGGLLADRWVNRTATVTTGALLMPAGHFLMAFETSFLLAIALLLVGVGCFKGNIASQVGELYERDDLRRATAFQVFQFSITSAVIVSPLVCGTLGEKVGWHVGFGAAGVGMLIGLAMYLHGRPWLPAEIRATDGSARRSLSVGDWKVLALLIALLPLIAGAMVGNQQMFNAFVVWGEANFDMHLLGYEMPVTWLLSADAVISALCILASIAFWRAFARREGTRRPDQDCGRSGDYGAGSSAALHGGPPTADDRQPNFDWVGSGVRAGQRGRLRHARASGAVLLLEGCAPGAAGRDDRDVLRQFLPVQPGRRTPGRPARADAGHPVLVHARRHRRSVRGAAGGGRVLGSTSVSAGIGLMVRANWAEQLQSSDLVIW
jgi:dipeptide/tripeptide permease